MSKMIYKYPVEVSEKTIEMPDDAEILSVHTQRDMVCIWALVDPAKPKVRRKFFVEPTGMPIKETKMRPKFLGTVFLGAHFVFHVFEDVSL